MNKAIINNIGYYILGIITVICSYWIIKNANWIIGDDIMFITGSGIGKNNVMMYGSGRFFPLAFQEFNILNLIPNGHTPIAHYIISLISFYAFIFILAEFYKKIISEKLNNKILISLFVCAFVLIYFMHISFMSMYMEIIFPERMVMLWLSLFMLSYYQGLKTQKTKWYILAALISVLNMYYKEPIFGSYLVFVVFSFCFYGKHLSKGQKIYNYITLLGCVSFLMSYYFIVYQNSTSFYNQGRYYGNFLNFLQEIFRWNKPFYIIILLGFYRGWQIIFKQDRSQLYTDGLLFSGLAYLCAYIFLNLNAAYYFLPVYVFCMPSLIVFSVSLFKYKKILGILAMIIFYATFSGCFIHVRGSIYFHQYKRQNDMAFLQQIADKYRQGYTIIWYKKFQQQEKNAFFNVSIADKFNKLDKFLTFALNGEKIQIKQISELKTPLQTKEILIYPPENEIESTSDFAILGKNVICNKTGEYFYYCLNKEKK